MTQVSPDSTGAGVLPTSYQRPVYFVLSKFGCVGGLAHESESAQMQNVDNIRKVIGSKWFIVVF